MNSANKIRIDKYIEERKLEPIDSVPVFLNGSKKNLEVYRLPIDLLFYNINNGRFAAEYKELLKKEGGTLRAEIPDEAVKIKNLLLSLNPLETQRTREDLLLREQWSPGIISEDGYVIDGNRRMSIISQLHDDTNEDKWRYLNVARFDGPVSSRDLWAIEGGHQLGKEEIVRYGPINELLKIREGIGAGLDAKTISKLLYGVDDNEINIKLKCLDHIDVYLEFMGIPEQYMKVKDNVEHFKELIKILASCKTAEMNATDTRDIKRAVFGLIQEGTRHMELRRIDQMISKGITKAIEKIIEAGSKLKPTPPSTSIPTSTTTFIPDSTNEPIPKSSETENTFSPTRTRFENAKDELDAQINDKNAALLLNRAEKNLRVASNFNKDDLIKSNVAPTLKLVASYVDKLQKKLVTK